MTKLLQLLTILCLFSSLSFADNYGDSYEAQNFFEFIAPWKEDTKVEKLRKGIYVNRIILSAKNKDTNIKIHELFLYGLNSNNEPYYSKNFVNPRKIEGSDKELYSYEIHLNETVYIDKIEIRSEAWSRAEERSHFNVELVETNNKPFPRNPPPKYDPPPREQNECEEEDRYEGERWEEIEYGNPIYRQIECNYGGNKQKVFERVIEFKCKNGRIKQTRHEREGDFIRKEGFCNTPPPQAKRCSNPTRSDGDYAWIEEGKIRENKTCPFGGKEFEVFHQEVRKQCNDGYWVSTGRTQKGRLKKRSSSKCSRPKNCNKLSIKHGQSKWVIGKKQIVKAIRCPFGGEEFNVFEKKVEKSCFNGVVSRTGQTKKGKSLGKRGPSRCAPASPCGPHPHGSSWNVNTGETTNKITACGHRKRGKQTSIMSIHHKNSCNNGHVSTKKSLVLKSKNACDISCAPAFINNQNGITETRPPVPTGYLKMVSIPAGKVGAVKNIACKDLMQKQLGGQDSSQVVPIKCMPNGLWQLVTPRNHGTMGRLSNLCL